MATDLLQDIGKQRTLRMCLLCAGGAERDGALARRAHVLDLLALIEHPDALPADAAVRLGREIMTLIAREPLPLQCDAVAPSEDDLQSARREETP